ncbi:MAG: exodeoxyribonuclease VII large subunit [Planctomycetota bacterium]|jgi:exodeoxyribonuclease VII large subunit
MTSPPHLYTVSELQARVRDFLEQEYGRVWVEGEISGFKRHHSGHLYFALRDADARLDAVMWRSTAGRMRFEPEEGLKVRARGNLTVYPRQGRYQMIVQALEPVGVGPLQVRFEQLRRQLAEEGLFDAEHKKDLPAFPRRVALITSPTGAAVRDLISVALRRWPPLELTVVPVKVQGEGAAEEIAEGLRRADGLGFDVLIAGRGGGSLEDLWAFNEEVVARAIFAAETPVVSAVGHEVDVAISDLVADVRAATPSAAAETVTPDGAEVRLALEGWRQRLGRGLSGKVDDLRRELEVLRQARPFRKPFERIREAGLGVDELGDRLVRGFTDILKDRRASVDLAAGRLEALSPLKVLARGYSVTLLKDRVVRRAAEVATGDELRTILAEGELRSRAL